jgi:chemotaxis protein methyltransferase CheR
MGGAELVMVSPDALIGDPAYLLLKEHLIGSTGLTYYVDKDIDLARRLGRRLSTTGVEDCATYLTILRDPLRGPPELDALIAEITIGETYFFRHQEHFDALRDRVLPDLMSRNETRNRASRSLRIWCAGCADGPEPYSLAILLKREMARQILGWEVTILGTDINRRCLARAREGRFEEWALRSTSEEIKRSCFSREGRCWNIAQEYKEWVSFQFHNLVEHSFPSLLNNLSAFDLIVCRNVMIYFGPDLMRRMIRQFYDCLVPGGWLVVGPAEPNMTCFTSFRAVNAPGVTLYQKPDQPSGPDLAVETFTAAPLPPVQTVPRARDWATRRVRMEPARATPPTLEDVRSYADSGAWEKASRCCEQLLEENNLKANVHFYRALVLEQMNKHQEAEVSLRRAIYLDRQSVLAHYYLGLFLQSRGDPKQAARSFENTLNLLQFRAGTDRFADADGITAAELGKLAAMHLEILREQV